MNILSIERVTLSFLVLAVTACSDSSGKSPDAEGTGGSATSVPSGTGGDQSASPGGGAGPSSGGATAGGGATGGAMLPAGSSAVPLTVDPTGWVDKGGNTVGIQGPWYSYDDCTDSPMSCTMNHVPGTGAFANMDGKMCTKGTTVPVKAEADFSKQWGAGIALDLNNSGGMDAMKLPYDATAAHVVGFSMTITGTAPGLRVNITSKAAGNDSHFVTAMVGGANTVLFSKAQQGSWVKTKTALDPTMLLAIQFQIPTVMSKAVDFDFCVEGLAAITQ
jgi:hypothetical protein